MTRRSTMLMTADQALTVDYRSEAWGRPPYNGATAYRPDFDSWLADHAVAGRARRWCARPPSPASSATAARVTGVRTDRPDGDLQARVVIACDGVNSLPRQGGRPLRRRGSGRLHLGVKETIALPREVIDERFGVRGDHGVDIEIIGCTGDVPGGGFVYTNLDTIAVGAGAVVADAGRAVARDPRSCSHASRPTRRSPPSSRAAR